MAKHPAIFLDRDGTIIEDNGHINILSNIEFYSYTFKALQNLQEHFLLFIITNQSGISKGLISEDEVKEVNRHIVEALKTKGITIFYVFYCRHRTALAEDTVDEAVVHSRDSTHAYPRRGAHCCQAFGSG